MTQDQVATTFGASLFAVGLLLAASLVWTFFVSGDCVSSGGSYDYSAGRCDQAINHPFVPFYRTWTFWLASAACIGGCLVAWRGTRGHEA